VPDDAAAVAVNVTIARAASAGFATVWPCGTDRPNASNVNYEAGNPTGNGVVAPVGDDGTICIHTSASADVLLDLVAYFDGSGPVAAAAIETAEVEVAEVEVAEVEVAEVEVAEVEVASAVAGSGAAFVATTPTRLVDTRTDIGGQPGRVAPNGPLRVTVRGAALDTDIGSLRVPDDASAVAMNVTIARPSSDGFATMWPCDAARPNASNVNFVAGRNRANSVIAPIGDDGDVCVHVSASAHVIVDVAGWFPGGDEASFTGAVPERLVDTRTALGPVPS